MNDCKFRLELRRRALIIQQTDLSTSRIRRALKRQLRGRSARFVKTPGLEKAD